jgi:hypothetical protein
MSSFRLRSLPEKAPPSYNLTLFSKVFNEKNCLEQPYRMEAINDLMCERSLFRGFVAGILIVGFTVSMQAFAEPANGGSSSIVFDRKEANQPLTCITIEVNRDGVIDKFEISPRPIPFAKLADCDLRFARISSVNLYGANLFLSDLSSANLSGANLSSSNLINANLSYTNLTNADLTAATLTGAVLTGCTGSPICH